MYKLIVRPLLFLLQPETVHHLVITLLKLFLLIPGSKFLLLKSYKSSSPLLNREVLGLSFTNPVGLAAGFDKNADFYDEIGSFGFSFVEIGTVTPKSQPGNPKPRSFRLKKDKALINRMGFNNKGVEYASNRLRKQQRNIVIGGNIGKNTNTPNDSAVDDYLYCFKELYDHVDYIAVNISCPNVANLRHLQEGEHLGIIFEALTAERKQRTSYKPILLKVSPDLSTEQLDETIQKAIETGIDGFIATNTTTSREGLLTDSKIVGQIGNGGLSGAPLTKRSTEIIRYIYSKTSGSKPIIGVGGILTPEDALEKLEAGASLVQVYTGFIYSGPSIVKRINNAILSKSNC